MSIYSSIIFPLIKSTDAETAHERTLSLLALAQRLPLGRSLLKAIAGDFQAESINLFGLRFPNVLGVAAGFDKNVQVVRGLAILGFGHVEVGTITPLQQPGNPRPRVFRLPRDRAIINRLGFPNVGSEEAVRRLISIRESVPGFIIGVSIGKQDKTSLEDAAEDYKIVMTRVFSCADYLALNISSPNTPGLRELQQKNYLRTLLRELVNCRDTLAPGPQVKDLPLLVKIAPDLTYAELDEILEVLMELGIDGVIATNTTTSRKDLTDKNRGEGGGLSGFPLAERSNHVINHIHKATGGKLPIIGVGGIFGADDVQKKLECGASLVQLYTSIVYEGPRIAGRILRQL